MGSHVDNESAVNIDEWKARVRDLNDQFRKDGDGGVYRFTESFVALGHERCAEVLQAIAAYDDFSPENDPPGLRDFGCVTVGGEPHFWHIDYLDKSELRESPDPADDRVTVRILKVMLSSDFNAA